LGRQCANARGIAVELGGASEITNLLAATAKIRMNK